MLWYIFISLANNGALGIELWVGLVGAREGSDPTEWPSPPFDFDRSGLASDGTFAAYTNTEANVFSVMPG